MPRPLSDQVVCITGASSGIGYCTALHLASRGARVVLMARNGEALERVAEEVAREGGEALAVPTDVTAEEQVEEAARRSVERFGRIDTWVNNAAVYIQGRVQDISSEEYRRILDVNVMGVIHGTRAALEPMLARGEGVIIQVSSVVARRGAPYASAYSASKQAVVGFTEALRAELWETDVRLSLLYLAAIDTPIYEHARAKLGTVPKPPPPIQDPEKAARAVAKLARTGDRELHLGVFRYAYILPDRISPALGDWFLHHTAGFTLGSRPAAGDNLDRPSTDAPRARGGWAEAGWRGVTLSEAARVLPVETALAGLGLAAGLGFLVWRALRDGRGG